VSLILSRGTKSGLACLNHPRNVQSEMDSCNTAHGPAGATCFGCAEAAGQHGFKALTCEGAQTRAWGSAGGLSGRRGNGLHMIYVGSQNIFTHNDRRGC